MYNTQQVAFFVAGQGMVIRNNVLRNKSNKVQWVSRSGYNKVTYDSYMENRGIDFSGSDIIIENNDVEVYNTRFETSNYWSNDGEGIMVQECCGGAKPLNLKINNNKLTGVNAYIGLYKTQDISKVNIEGNQMTNQQIYVNANTNSNSFTCNDILIQNNTGVKGITLRGDKYGVNCAVKNNSGTGSIDANCFVEVLNNSGFTLKTCTPIKDYATEPDSICYGTFCFPNTNKLEAECLIANGLPVVNFTSAPEIVLSNESSVRLNMEKVSGLVDSIVVYNNNKVISRSINIPAYIDVPISDYNQHYFRIQAFGCSQLYPKHTNSNSILVYKIHNFLSTSIIEVPETDFELKPFPNPAQNQIFINAEVGSDISIFTLSGRFIQSFKSTSYQQRIDISNYQTSIYVINVLSPKGLLSVDKFIKI